MLTFNPDSKQDYKFEITVQTEREKFMLPVVCHGSRIEIQIPEMLDFGSTPVKYLKEQTIMLKNRGDKATKYLMRTNPPFNIDSKEGFLDIGGTRLVNVCYLPTKIKHYSEPL